MSPDTHSEHSKAKSRRQLILYSFAGVFLIFSDQLTKFLSVLFLKGKDAFVLIPDILELHYLENQSAAFGIDPITLLQKVFSFSYFETHPDALLTYKMVFFLILTVLVVGIILVIFLRIPGRRRFLPVNLALLFFVSGALGNLIDRVSHQYVIDFIYFKLIYFPIFNVADIYVTISACMLILFSFFYYKEEDYEEIFPPKKGKDNKKERTVFPPKREDKES